MSEEEIIVRLEEDHLRRLTHVRKPLLAVAELVWNALDADASRVDVVLQRNALGGIEAIVVEDNGHGVRYDDVPAAFGSLGGSWKVPGQRSHEKGRLLHGQAGKGRFRAFALGPDVTWSTRYRQDGQVYQFAIKGSLSKLLRFTRTTPEPVELQATGTTVTISSIQENFPSLCSQGTVLELASDFALYLKQYGDVEFAYDGHAVTPSDLVLEERSYQLAPILAEDGRELRVDLGVIEWRTAVERALYLCDENGFAVAEVPVGIKAPGFAFTAYLKCALLRELERDGALVLEELHPALRDLLHVSRAKLKEHFRERAARASTELVREWKDQHVYPYEGDPVSTVERVERQVFDVLALNVHEYLPDFAASDVRSKRLSFSLLRRALEESPEAVQRIVQDVLQLPKDKQDELAGLLEQTTLSAIIAASKEVADRLDFLRVLEILLFDPEVKGRVRERTQLHKLLESRTWVFGEEFALSVSDQSLTEVLRKHIAMMDRAELCPEPVTREDGSVGIVDLMLSRSVPQPDRRKREHLIIELKAPSVRIDADVLKQIKSYARAVMLDERFHHSSTRWVFWAVSNSMTAGATEDVRERGKPPGLLWASDHEPWCEIWVKTWNEILDQCKARLSFFQENLAYSPDDEVALERLRELHAKYLPDETGTARESLETEDTNGP